MQLHSFLISTLDGCTWLTSHTDRSTPGKEPRYLPNRRLLGHQGRSKSFGEEKYLQPLAGLNPGPSSPFLITSKPSTKWHQCCFRHARTHAHTYTHTIHIFIVMRSENQNLRGTVAIFFFSFFLCFLSSLWQTFQGFSLVRILFF